MSRCPRAHEPPDSSPAEPRLATSLCQKIEQDHPRGAHMGEIRGGLAARISPVFMGDRAGADDKCERLPVSARASGSALCCESWTMVDSATATTELSPRDPRLRAGGRRISKVVFALVTAFMVAVPALASAEVRPAAEESPAAEGPIAAAESKASSKKKSPSKLTFATYNICMTEPWCSDMRGAPSKSARTKQVYKRVRTISPDVLAIQEGSALFNGITHLNYTHDGEPEPVVNPALIDNGLGKVSKYFRSSRVGKNFRVAFDPTENSAGLGIYVNTKRVNFVRDGSGAIDTRSIAIGADPEVIATAATERKTPRQAIFVHLEDKSTGSRFWFGTTHFSNGKHLEEKAARMSQMLAVQAVVESFGETPVVFAGDFNEARTVSTDRVLSATAQGTHPWLDAQDLTKSKSRVKINSFQKWKKKPTKSSSKVGRHVNRVLVSKSHWKVNKWVVSTTILRGKFTARASDHLPIVVKIQLRR